MTVPNAAASTSDPKMNELLYLARVSEQAERYDEMASYMCRLAELKPDFNQDERNMLSVAYKNALGTRRAAHRILQQLEEREQTRGKGHQVAVIHKYIESVASELNKCCVELLKTVDDHLVPATKPDSHEAMFYHKLRADYYRYQCETIPSGSDEHRRLAELSLKEYTASTHIASDCMAATHPLRLGLALNFSVFFFETLNQPIKACHVAKVAFDDAIAGLDELDEDGYRDSTMIMQLLRDNLTLWLSDGSLRDEVDEAPQDEFEATV